MSKLVTQKSLRRSAFRKTVLTLWGPPSKNRQNFYPCVVWSSWSTIWGSQEYQFKPFFPWRCDCSSWIKKQAYSLQKFQGKNLSCITMCYICIYVTMCPFNSKPVRTLRSFLIARLGLWNHSIIRWLAGFKIWYVTRTLESY